MIRVQCLRRWAPGGRDAAEKSRKASTPLNYRRMMGATGGGHISMAAIGSRRMGEFRSRLLFDEGEKTYA